MSTQPYILKAQIKERGIPIVTIAMRLRISPGHLRDILCGRKIATPELLRAIAQLAKHVSPRGPSQEKTDKLVEAASRAFMAQRGYYCSTICQGGSGACTQQRGAKR